MLRTAITTVLGALIMASASNATIRTKTIEYIHDGVTFEGFLAWDDAHKTPRPGVMVIHEWKGLESYAKSRTEQLAGLGYVAFAADLYGKGIRPQTPEEAGAQAGKLRADRPLMRARALASLEVLAGQSIVDRNKLACIGFCFGGGATLELARNGAPLKGAVSFHGNLDTPNLIDANNIKAKVLVLHGAIDPVISPESIATFQKEMTDAKVDWQFVSYGGAVHAFTNPAAGERYHPDAARRSWEAMKDFFDEIFE